MMFFKLPSCSSFVAALALPLMAATAVLAADASRSLPAPTGTMPVGRMTIYWADDARPEATTEDPNDHRQLRVDVWYPAEAGTSAERAPYFADLPALRKALGMEAFLYGSRTTHALDRPPIAPGSARFAVIIFSPGAGMNAAQYTSIVEELASHGYVVAAVDHPFQSKAIAYPDGRVARFAEPSPVEFSDPQHAAAGYRQRVELRADDLRFVLDQLQALDKGGLEKRFAGRLDLARVGALGHSIGGIAAAQVCMLDSRFKAAANMDGHASSLPFLPSADGQGPRQPFIELTDGPFRPTDKSLAEAKITRQQFEQQAADAARRADRAMRSLAGGSFRVTIPGVRHLSFSDEVMLDPGTPDERDRRSQIVRDYVRAFFDKTLLGKADTPLDVNVSPYAEVSVERFEPAK